MRIGFDATAIPARPAGAGNYILELVAPWSSLSPPQPLSWSFSSRSMGWTSLLPDALCPLEALYPK